MDRTTRDYAPVNGLRIYYEIHGVPHPSHPPLVLLHGGGDTIATSFGKVLPILARGRQVIAFEQQGYGRTADVAGRPFAFEQSADDTVALLQHLNITQADLMGFSNGGTIALQVALRHPQIVRKLIMISAFTRRTDPDPQFWGGFANATLNDMPKELRDAYLAVSPNADGLQAMFDKSVNRMRNFKDIPDDAVRGVVAPVLIMIGDRDVVRPEAAVEQFRLFRDARLAIVPGSDHGLLMTSTAAIVPMIDDFLA